MPGGEIFGDEVTAVAMIDRLVHHAEILSLKGDSYRLRDNDLGPASRDWRAQRSCCAPPYELRSAAVPNTLAHPAPAMGAFQPAPQGALFNRP